ncbi:MAG: class II aldolase/adducin family protein [Betaproteobacteria bacterium]
MNQLAVPHAAFETTVLALKKRLAKVHRIITAGGLWPITKGHVSCRVPETNHVLILGHIHADGRNLANTDVDDIVTIDIDGNFIEGRVEAVEERYAHTEVYKARPDVHAVIHAHPTMATAFGIAGVNILPVGNRGTIFAPHVPILDFDKQIDTPERGRMAAQALGKAPAVVLKNHGVVVASDTIENVCISLFALEETAQLHWYAAQLGKVEPISDGEVRRVMTGTRYEEYFSHVWGHYAALDPRHTG